MYVPNAEEGDASWYGPGFEGLRTASGEIFHQSGLSAASMNIPLGALVQVTNLSNGRSVRVRINDCGPYVHRRIIDLSRAAADHLAFIRVGIQRVRVLILDQPPAARTCSAPSRRNTRVQDPSSAVLRGGGNIAQPPASIGQRI
jgi:rare lipoprotein A